jgi:plastocyanin domain-containing protein
MIEAIKEEISKPLNEIQENASTQVESFKKEANENKGIQENAIKQVKDMNKTV